MDDLAERLAAFASQDSPRGADSVWQAAHRTARRHRVARRGLAALTVAVLAVVALTVAAGHRDSSLQSPSSTTTTMLPLPRTTGPGAHCLAINPKHPYVTPDPGFNPLTATPAELDQHHFPPRPPGTRWLAQWTKYANDYMAGRIVQCANPSPSQQPAWIKRYNRSRHHLGK